MVFEPTLTKRFYYQATVFTAKILRLENFARQNSFGRPFYRPLFLLRDSPATYLPHFKTYNHESFVEWQEAIHFFNRGFFLYLPSKIGAKTVVPKCLRKNHFFTASEFCV